MRLPPTSPLKRHLFQLAAALLALILIAVGQGYLVKKVEAITAPPANRLASTTATLSTLHATIGQLKNLRHLLSLATDAGINTDATQKALPDIIAAIKRSDYGTAQTTLTALQATVTKQEADAAAIELQRGTISGTVRTAGSTLAGATITLLQNGIAITSAQSDANGLYSFHVLAGTYEFNVVLTGYTPQDLEQVVTAGKTTSYDAVLIVVPPPTPTPTPTPTATPTPKPKPTATPTPRPTATPPPSSSSTTYSSYYTTTLTSSHGSFSAWIMSFQLGAGKIKVATDTASDTDCANNCAALSVQGYVSRFGGIAGINGTYFCPPDYSSCAGQTNSFFWKILNSRLGRMINASDGLGENDPFITFDAVGNPRLFSSWNSYMSSGYTAYAGINHKPLIVNNGANVLDNNTLDSKQLSSKISRAAIAIKGSTMYVVEIAGATVPDLAAVVQNMGVDYAMNIDSGGSAGMYYNGAYRLGPGRAVPNALVFIQQ